MSENLGNILGDLNLPVPSVEDIPLVKQEEMIDVLRNYVKIGVIGPACDRAGIRRKTHYEWLDAYPKYKAVYGELKERFLDGLEQVAIERAKEKSDNLLQFLLKSYRRDIFGDQSKIQHEAKDGGVTLVFAEGMLNEEEKKMMREGGPDGSQTET